MTHTTFKESKRYLIKLYISELLVKPRTPNNGIYSGYGTPTAEFVLNMEYKYRNNNSRINEEKEIHVSSMLARKLVFFLEPEKGCITQTMT